MITKDDVKEIYKTYFNGNEIENNGIQYEFRKFSILCSCCEDDEIANNNVHNKKYLIRYYKDQSEYPHIFWSLEDPMINDVYNIINKVDLLNNVNNIFTDGYSIEDVFLNNDQYLVLLMIRLFGKPYLARGTSTKRRFDNLWCTEIKCDNYYKEVSFNHTYPLGYAYIDYKCTAKLRNQNKYEQIKYHKVSLSVIGEIYLLLILCYIEKNNKISIKSARNI